MIEQVFKESDEPPVRVGDVISVRGTDQHRRVCAVESCRISRNGEWLEPYTEEHAWKIYLGTDWLGGTREEAEAIYERYRCDCSLAFDYEGGEVGARAHLLGPRNGTYRQVSIGDTVYRDSDGVQVRRVSECVM